MGMILCNIVLFPLRLFRKVFIFFNNINIMLSNFFVSFKRPNFSKLFMVYKVNLCTCMFHKGERVTLPDLKKKNYINEYLV